MDKQELDILVQAIEKFIEKESELAEKEEYYQGRVSAFKDVLSWIESEDKPKQ